MESIYNQFWLGVSCKFPVQPNDDLLDNLDTAQKSKFKEAMSNFIDDAKAALNEPNQLKASKLWKRHLGSLFPEGRDGFI